jgi:hypothetical protein
MAKELLPTAERVRQIRELIAALDHRVPHVEREGEAEIAREARLLREKAVQRLTELGEQP